MSRAVRRARPADAQKYDEHPPEAAVTLPQDVQGCLALWAEAMRLAVEDAVRYLKGRNRLEAGAAGEAYRSLCWLFEDGTDVGSVRWICVLFDLDVERVRSKLLERAGASRARVYGLLGIDDAERRAA